MFFSPANARVALSNTSRRQSTSSNQEANMSSSSSSNEEVASLMFSPPGISGVASQRKQLRTGRFESSANMLGRKGKD